MTPALDPIETLCALDAAGRGIGRLVVPGAMAEAARSLARATRVALVTGFVPRPEWAAETDGPSGTVVLGRAVRQLGAEVGVHQSVLATLRELTAHLIDPSR